VQHRRPTAQESEVLQNIVEALREQDRQPVGRLYNAGLWDPDLDRRKFEKLLGALARSGLVRLSLESFEKSGQSIEYRRASLTPEGRRLQGPVTELVQIPTERPKPPRKKRPPKGAKKVPGAKAVALQTAPPKENLLPDTPQAQEVHPALLAALKAWRLEEAHRRGVPAFRIFSDRTLKAVATSRPRNEEELLGLYGFGPKNVRQYGSKVLKIVASTAT
jgi:DNA topoisomerase-3